MSSVDEAKLEDVIVRGLSAVESDDLETAEEALEEAQKMAGENHVRTLHLAGMIAWGHGDAPRALGFLMQATDLGSDRADIYLDCAEAILVSGEDVTEAEVAVREALSLENLTERERDEAHLTLAQIRLELEDPAGAMELLGKIRPELQGHPAYCSTLAAALLASDRVDEAIEAIEKAVATEPDDPDFHYQLALTARAGGQEERARAAMARVLELDGADDPAEELPYAETQDLRSRLEDVLEDIPDPILRLVANAPIVVQRRATDAQVVVGVDARSVVVFEGTCRADSEDDEAELARIIIMRELLLEDIQEDDEIPAVLFYGLMEQIREFFGRDDILYALSDG